MCACARRALKRMTKNAQDTDEKMYYTLLLLVVLTHNLLINNSCVDYYYQKGKQLLLKIYSLEQVNFFKFSWGIFDSSCYGN